MQRILTALILGTLATTTAAQFDSPPITPGKIGFSIAGANGRAGIFCSGFACMAPNLGINRGEQLTFQYRTTFGAPWVLLIGLTALPTCPTVPGILNQWAGPLTVVAFGGITRRDVLIRCWGGWDSTTITVPQNLNLRDTFAFQVVANNLTLGPAFSAPVVVTVVK